jgi:hypothetical protein
MRSVRQVRGCTLIELLVVIGAFDNDGSAVAPGGGRAFIAGTNGDPVTGAIGIVWDPGSALPALHRPACTGLTTATAKVTAEETRHLP